MEKLNGDTWGLQIWRNGLSAKTVMRRIWLDDDIKEQATQALTVMGLSMSDAVRRCLHHVVLDGHFLWNSKYPMQKHRRPLLSPA